MASPNSQENSAVDQNEVIGAVRTIYNTFEEANQTYMEQNFPKWREKEQTFIIPPQFEYRDPYIPQDGSNTPKLSKDAFDRLRGDQAEEKVVRAFTEYGRDNRQPMFIFHNFKFQLLQRRKKQLSLGDKQVVTRETDVIIVHRDLGVIVVEIKAMKNEYDEEKDKDKYDNQNKNNNQTYESAGEQLKKAESLLKKFCLLANVENGTITKVIACPNLQEMPSSSSVDNIHLCKHDLNDFDRWWRTMIYGVKRDRVFCNSIYCDLVPKLLCGRSDICVFLSRSTIKTLDQQESIKLLANKQGLSDITKKAITRSKWLYLTPEQCAAWNRDKQIICGPFGSGKTILIQCKAAELARSGEEVMVIVPYHLVPQYKKFFEENSVKNIELCAFEDILKYFYTDLMAETIECKKRLCSKHVFVDELLWPYAHFSEHLFRFTDDYYAHYKDPADNVVDNYGLDPSSDEEERYSDIVGRHQDQMERKSDEEDYVSECEWECDDPSEYFDPDCVRECDDSILPGTTDSNADLYSYDKRMGKGDPRVSGELDQQSEPVPADVHNFTVSYMKFLDFLDLLFKYNERTKCVWIALHLHSLVWCLMQTSFRWQYDKNQINLVRIFIEMLQDQHITTLKSSMRTTKELHDFRCMAEWHAFCNIKSYKHSFVKDKICKMAFTSHSGHSISGHSPQTIKYPTDCAQYDVSNMGPTEDVLDHFIQFCTGVLITKIKKLLHPLFSVILKTRRKGELKYCLKEEKRELKPQDIAIICDRLERSNKLVESLKQSLQGQGDFTLCSVEEHLKRQGGEHENAVTIGYSCETASLEWPVVIHVRFAQLITCKTAATEDNIIVSSAYPTFGSDHSLIISRCMAYYILICREDDDVASLSQNKHTFNYDLQLENETIRNLPTLFAKSSISDEDLNSLGWSGDMEDLQLPYVGYVIPYRM